MLTAKDIQHYADLGRIRLSSAEKAALVKDFKTIIAYVAKLSEVNTDAVLPMNGGVLFFNRFRDDGVDLERKTEKMNETSQIVRGFPEAHEGYLKVPPVFTD
ncbi:MAG: Asp-tRNA(Asn)/Glu-tRNA(Gln) amidotransferase subunit GatC [Patescibacteria group bacterium]|nr:Asp-tRNA(Asn)/Glu-tRNA(Gln) amidotransferase subunit GatC [Patescibacteria group bacterium]MDE2438098.1 Asp-tRNA(Asn)/Glu-tRNA(Gln) amidotransferase subunit GatC [Patescibacteria group bacterium]